jgi:hypothetical protein
MVLGVKVWALATCSPTTPSPNCCCSAASSSGRCSASAPRARATAPPGTVYPPGRAGPTVVTVLVGAVAWAFFAFWAHEHWIGMRPI